MQVLYARKMHFALYVLCMQNPVNGYITENDGNIEILRFARFFKCIFIIALYLPRNAEKSVVSGSHKDLIMPRSRVEKTYLYQIRFKCRKHINRTHLSFGHYIIKEDNVIALHSFESAFAPRILCFWHFCCHVKHHVI